MHHFRKQHSDALAFSLLLKTCRSSNMLSKIKCEFKMKIKMKLFSSQVYHKFLRNRDITSMYPTNDNV